MARKRLFGNLKMTSGPEPPSYIWSETNLNGTKMGIYLTRVELRFLCEALQQFKQREWVLDIGGGDGRLARRLQAQGIPSILLEYSDLPLRDMKNSGWSHPLLQADGNTVPLKNETAETILAVEVQNCVDSEHNERFFSEVYRVLKQKGIFVFTSDNSFSLIGFLRKIRPSLYRYEDCEYYSESFRMTQKKLEKAGFRVLMVYGFRWIPFSRGSKNSLIPLFAIIERLLQLKRLPSLSPWVFWVVRKSGAQSNI